MRTEKISVKQVAVLGDELVEGLGVAVNTVECHEVHPAARDRVVVLVACAVQTRDLPNCSGHGSARLVRFVQLEVAPGQLQVLPVAEVTPPIEDRAKDVEVLIAHVARTA